MLRHVGLHEQRAARRVEPRRQQPHRHLERAWREGCGVVRLGDGVQIHDAVDALELGLQRDPVHDRADVVAEVELARRLDAAEDPVHPRKLRPPGGTGK